MCIHVDVLELGAGVDEVVADADLVFASASCRGTVSLCNPAAAIRRRFHIPFVFGEFGLLVFLLTIRLFLKCCKLF